MIATIGRRLLLGVPTLVGVSLIVFLILRLIPGDPVAALVSGTSLSAAQIAALRENAGLDEPVYVQFAQFFAGLLRMDLGTSFATRQPVTEMIAGQIAPTLALAFAATIVTSVLGISLGVAAATFSNTVWDGVIRILSLVATSVPSFWIGLILIMTVSFQLGWFPATGTGGLDRLVLPAVALGIPGAGVVSRLVRNNIIEVKGENFVTALHAKGIPAHTVMLRHVLRSAILPAVTAVGLQIGVLLAGAVIIEAVFARQGLGNLLQQAITMQDYPVIQGVVLVIAIIYILVNILVDISYTIIDPRLRVSGPWPMTRPWQTGKTRLLRGFSVRGGKA